MSDFQFSMSDVNDLATKDTVTARHQAIQAVLRLVKKVWEEDSEYYHEACVAAKEAVRQQMLGDLTKVTFEAVVNQALRTALSAWPLY